MVVCLAVARAALLVAWMEFPRAVLTVVMMDLQMVVMLADKKVELLADEKVVMLAVEMVVMKVVQ